MLCPICRIPLEQSSVKGSLRPVCRQCSGVWFEEEQFFRFLDITKKYRQESLDDYQPPVSGGLSLEEGFCPQCNLLMEEQMVDKTGPFAGSYLSCSECPGIFIRRPELTLVEYLYCRGSWPSRMESLSEVLKSGRNTQESGVIGERSFVKGLLNLVDVDNPRKHFPLITSVIITVNILLTIGPTS